MGTDATYRAKTFEADLDRAGASSPPTSSAKNPAQGTVLKGRFLLSELIASGGTSDIFRAKDLLAAHVDERSSELVVKVPRPSAVQQGRLRYAMALHETSCARRVRHEGVVTVHDCDRDGGVFFVTMEHLPGETLAERLQRSPGRHLPPHEALHIVRAVAAALKATHEQGLVHSDIKPANIMLGPDGAVKLIDFSTARPFARAGERAAPDYSNYSGYSPAYASPEVLADAAPHPSDDVYSLACIAYEALTGRHPFDRMTSADAAQKALVPARHKALSRQQYSALKQGLAFTRASRFQDARSFVAALERPPILRRQALAALACTIVGAAAWAVAAPRLEQFAQEQHTLRTLAAQLAQTEQVVAEIRAAPPTQRPRTLERTTQLPEPFRSAALGLVGEEVAASLQQRIDQELRIDGASADVEQLRQELLALRALYPAADRLNKAEDLLERSAQRGE